MIDFRIFYSIIVWTPSRDRASPKPSEGLSHPAGPRHKAAQSLEREVEMLKRKVPLLVALALLPLLAARAAAAEESLPELVRRVKPSVVSVITYDQKGEVKITGSGFFVRPGQILTNLHVVEGASRAEVRTFDGKGKTYAVEGLLAVDAEGDLALLDVSSAQERSRAVETSATLPEEGE